MNLCIPRLNFILIFSMLFFLCFVVVEEIKNLIIRVAPVFYLNQYRQPLIN